MAQRFGFYIALQLASIVIPGLLLLGDAVFLTGMLLGGRPDQIGRIANRIEELNGVAALAFVSLSIATAYVAGYLLRSAGFWALGRLTRYPPIAKRLRRAVTRDDLIESCGEAALADACRHHPVLARLPSRAAEPRSDDQAVAQAFVYSKLWLRLNAPPLAEPADVVEFEINVMTASLMPITLLALDVGLGANRIGVWVVAALGIALIWPAIAIKLMQCLLGERMEAIRNLVLAYAYRETSGDPTQPSQPDQALSPSPSAN